MILQIQISQTADIMSAANTNIITTSRVNRQVYRQHHRVLLGMELTMPDVNLNIEESIALISTDERRYESDKVSDDPLQTLSITSQNKMHQLNIGITIQPEIENAISNQIVSYQNYQYDKFYFEYPQFHPKRTTILKSVIQVLDDPLAKLCVDLMAGGFALFEISNHLAFFKFSAYQAFLLYPLINGLKAISTLLQKARIPQKKLSAF